MDGFELEKRFKKAYRLANIQYEDTHGTAEDISRGTDFFVTVNGHTYRIDPTFDMRWKQQTSAVQMLGNPKMFSEGGLTLEVTYGIRTNNGHRQKDGTLKQFDEPVLVIGIKDYSGNFDAFVPAYWADVAFTKMVPEITINGVQQFRTYEIKQEIMTDPFAIGDLRPSEQTEELQMFAVQMAQPDDIEFLYDCLHNPSEDVLQAMNKKAHSEACKMPDKKENALDRAAAEANKLIEKAGGLKPKGKNQMITEKEK